MNEELDDRQRGFHSAIDCIRGHVEKMRLNAHQRNSDFINIADKGGRGSRQKWMKASEWHGRGEAFLEVLDLLAKYDKD